MNIERSSHSYNLRSGACFTGAQPALPSSRSRAHHPYDRKQFRRDIANRVEVVFDKELRMQKMLAFCASNSALGSMPDYAVEVWVDPPASVPKPTSCSEGKTSGLTSLR